MPSNETYLYIGWDADATDLPPKYAVIDGNGGVVVDQLKDIEAGQSRCLLHGAPLRLVEVTRHRDHAFADLRP